MTALALQADPAGRALVQRVEALWRALADDPDGRRACLAWLDASVHLPVADRLAALRDGTWRCTPIAP